MGMAWVRDWDYNTGGNCYRVRYRQRRVWPGFGSGLVVGGHVSGLGSGVGLSVAMVRNRLD